MEIFDRRIFRAAAVMIFAGGVAMFGASIYLPLFQQTVQHASATNSGLLLVPMILGLLIAAQITGGLMSKTGEVGRRRPRLEQVQERGVVPLPARGRDGSG